MDSFYVECLKAFHLKFDHTLNETPTIPSEKDVTLRIRLMREELAELIAAMQNEKIVSIADGLADLLYVVIGTAIVYGIPLDSVFGEVHQSNMTKGDKKDGYGKVLKGAHFRPPQITQILERHGWRKV